MKVVVITAHPDDLEIACGGTLLRLQSEGAEIISVITVKPSAEVNEDRSKYIVEHELEKSYKLSGFKLKVLDTDLHPNGRPNLVCDNRTMTSLENLIETSELAIIPNPQDYHQDHRNTYNLAWPIVQKTAKEIWVMESWPYCQYYKENHANVFYNITNQWNDKRALLNCYSSYLSSNDISQIDIYNQWLGQRAQTKYAEAFILKHKNV